MNRDNVANPEEVKKVDQSANERGTEKKETSRLIESWQNTEGQGGPCIIPDAIAVAGDHMKHIGPRSKVRIESLSSRSCILPFRIASIEAIFEVHILRRC